MAMRYRYSEWDGTQSLPSLDADDEVELAVPAAPVPGQHLVAPGLVPRRGPLLPRRAQHLSWIDHDRSMAAACDSEPGPATGPA